MDMNEEYIRSKTVTRLMGEIEVGWESAKEEGWVSEEKAYEQLSDQKK